MLMLLVRRGYCKIAVVLEDGLGCRSTTSATESSATILHMHGTTLASTPTPTLTATAPRRWNDSFLIDLKLKLLHLFHEEGRHNHLLLLARRAAASTFLDFSVILFLSLVKLNLWGGIGLSLISWLVFGIVCFGCFYAVYFSRVVKTTSGSFGVLLRSIVGIILMW